MQAIIINTDPASIRKPFTPATLPEWTLFRILFAGDEQAAEIILTYRPNLFNYTILDRHNRSLLHAAAYGNIPNITEFLLARNCPLSQLDDQNRSVLHYAAFKAEFPLVQKLLENNTMINATDNFNR